jgi:hypothetical protein
MRGLGCRFGFIAGLAAMVLCMHAGIAAAITFTGPTDYPLHYSLNTVVTADFNGDSDPDLAASSDFPNGNVAILVGGAGASFTGPTNYSAGSQAQTLAVGDFNGDSDPDLVVGRTFGSSVSILLGGPGATFGPPVEVPSGITPRSIAVGDFNGDSDPDLAVGDYNGIRVLLAGPGATFAAPTSYSAAAQAIATGDFNGDGSLDLVGTDFQLGTVNILLGAGNGTFGSPTGLPAGASPRSPVVADFNGDGKRDLVVSGNNDVVNILIGAGNGTLGSPDPYPTGSQPLGVVARDFNGDFDPDLAVANGQANTVSILAGTLAGTFQPKVDYPASSSGSPQSIAVGDFDGDGDSDLAVAHYSGTGGISILLNTPTALSVSDVTQAEGNSGQTFFDFTVSLNGPSPEPVSVDYQTQDGTAIASGDYATASGTLTFVPGETTKTVRANINGDTAFEPNEAFNLVLSNPNGAALADGTGVGTIQNDDEQGYVRPKGATPVYAPLVVAYRTCTAPNRVHASPLNYNSCNPPVPLSSYLTVGTPDANGQAANAVGWVRYRAIAGNPSTPADEADVALTLDMTDVRGLVTLGDYIGELWATVPVQLTDRSSNVRQTTTVFNFGFAVPCTATADPAAGATCSLSTTADSVLPGAVVEGDRAIWELGQIQVQDGGDDGVGSTTSDNTRFLRQGVFIP